MADGVDVKVEFELIRWAVARFGSALDAEDHGQGIASPGLVAEGNDALRLVFARSPRLRAWLPRTWALVEAGGSLEAEGALILRELRAAEWRARVR